MTTGGTTGNMAYVVAASANEPGATLQVRATAHGDPIFPTETAASTTAGGRLTPDHLGEGDSRRPRQPNRDLPQTASAQQEDPPWSIGGGGRPVGNGPRFFRYVDRGFRVGGLGDGREDHLGRAKASRRASHYGDLPQTAAAQQADPPWSIGGGGSRAAGGPRFFRYEDRGFRRR